MASTPKQFKKLWADIVDDSGNEEEEIHMKVVDSDEETNASEEGINNKATKLLQGGRSFAAIAAAAPWKTVDKTTPVSGISLVREDSGAKCSAGDPRHARRALLRQTANKARQEEKLETAERAPKSNSTKQETLAKALPRADGSAIGGNRQRRRGAGANKTGMDRSRLDW